MVKDPLQWVMEMLQPQRLLEGDWIQRQVYEALERMQLLSVLAPFEPIVTGTYPLGVHIAGSDLDVSCYLPLSGELEQVLLHHFSGYPQFRMLHQEREGIPTLIARWYWGMLPVEVFAQPIPPLEQRAVRHLLIEQFLLEQFPALRPEVRKLKQQGLNTEAAFVRALGIEAEPFSFLYDLSFQPVERILEIVTARQRAE